MSATAPSPTYADGVGDDCCGQRAVTIRLNRTLLDRIVSHVTRWLARSRTTSPAPDGNNEPPSRAWGRPLTLFLASQITVGVLIGVATGVLVLHLRDRALADADAKLRSLSLMLAHQAERTFDAVELVETAILQRVQDEGVRTPEAFRQRMSGAAMQDEFRVRAQMLPQLEAIVVIDADGQLVNVSRFWPVPEVNVARQAFFQALKTDRTQTVRISDPIQNPGTGTWTIFVVRKVTGPDGEFLGLIEGAVRLSYFEQLYRTLSVGSDTSISLFRQDGILLARYPRANYSVGQSFARSGVFKHLEAVEAAVVRLPGLLDGEERMIAGHALARYPVVVTASATVLTLLAEWRSQATYLIGAAVILELVMAGVGLLVLRQLRGQRLLTKAQAARTEAEAARQRAEAELVVAQERMQADHILQVQNLRFGAALSNMSQALCMFDFAGSLVVANDRLADLLGISAAGIAPGPTIETLLGRATGASNLHPPDIDMLRSSIQQLRMNATRAARVHELADGRTLAVNFAPVENDGWMLTLEDITEQRVVEAKITHMAHHDALTGLPNRVLFHARLNEAVARSRRGECCAVLYLDLDHFKAVNDTLGHPIGDALLQAVTSRLRSQVRETDIMARLGGDEFAIVQSSSDQPKDATILARRLIEALGAPYEIDGHQMLIGTSIGIAIVPNDGDHPDQLLKNADLALYRAKADGRSRYRFFEPEMDALMQARRTLEIDLRKALVAGEFELFYQPLMNLKTGMVTGFEALLRWFHPERGMVSPADFVPLAEEIGLIVPLGEWALHRACADAMTWPETVKVAVNVSVIQFASGTLVEDVAAALAATGLQPNRLELEITESVMLDDTDAILVILHQLRDLGVGIAMDDFGTGYSSLSYLRRFPFSKVKIDRSFIEGLGKGGDCDAIVTAVTELCATLGMVTLAEGVETREQLQQLRVGNCGEAQGYLFSRPRPASEVQALCIKLGQQSVVEPVI